MEGILFLDKPGGMTSHDVVDAIRKIAGMRQVGHAGTLDPMATGLLILGLGRGTKALEFFEGLDKEYHVKVKFGEETDTLDRDGKVLRTADASHVTREATVQALTSFEGEYDQVVPAYSAVRVQGKKLYELARSGQKVQTPSRKVKIVSNELICFEAPFIEFRVRCTKGCYVRALARDVGERLKTVATCYDVRRLKVGEFAADVSPKLGDLKSKDDLAKHLKPIEQALTFFAEIKVTKDQETKFLTGQVINVKPEGELMRIVGPSGFLGIGQQSWNRYIKPRKVLK